MPTIYARGDFAEAGGLLSYAPDDADLYRRAAAYAGKIFKGAKPANLPIEQPMKFQLALNIKAARAIGITIPDVIMLRADKVIE